MGHQFTDNSPLYNHPGPLSVHCPPPPNCDIFKTAKYNCHQHFSFYSNPNSLWSVLGEICYDDWWLSMIMTSMWTIIKQLHMGSTLRCVLTAWWFLSQPQITPWCQLNYAHKKVNRLRARQAFHWAAKHRLYFQTSNSWHMLENAVYT